MADGYRRVEETPAIPGLPNHLVVAHIVGSDKLNDPTDLARLTAVSRGMRAAVAATKRTIKKPNEYEAGRKGYLTTLKHMHSRGRLSRKECLCAAAASSGQLEELKSLRAGKLPWDERTCWYAALGGHLEVLKWARANGCPWGIGTCALAAEGGHLEVLEWLREKLPVERVDVRVRRAPRSPGVAAMGSREWMPVGQVDVRVRGGERPLRGAEVGARERLPVGQENARTRGSKGIRRNLSRRLERDVSALRTKETRH